LLSRIIDFLTRGRRDNKININNFSSYHWLNQMSDIFTREKRSEIMRSIKSKDTKPEMAIRRGLHRLGFRFRLHDANLPGTPDIVLPRYKTVIQVRGCFWHGHRCKHSHIPKTRSDFWEQKINKNKKRDAENDALLKKGGWNLIIIWECMCTTQKEINATLEKLNFALKEDLSFLSHQKK